MKNMVTEQIGKFPVDSDNAGELDVLIMYLDKLKVKTGGVYHNINFHIDADYDGRVELITFHGDRLETDEEHSARTERAQKIFDAWDKHDKGKKNAR